MRFGAQLLAVDIKSSRKLVAAAQSLTSAVEKNDFYLARSWLKTCSTSHRECQPEVSTNLPTRLLSIAKDPPRLVSTANWTSRPLYATLSHCWGQNDFLKLTRDNLSIFTNMVPIERLTKTFRDAVQIARGLGIDFIWIDSLCIIQDDNNDWEKESSLMSSVYCGSSINIAASSAKDGSEGCLPKPPYACYGFIGEVGTKGEHLHNFQVPELYEKSTTQSHLATRAWAFQERFLAPRTLHCGDRGFFWECRSHVASEFILSGLMGPRQKHMKPKGLSLSATGHETISANTWQLDEWTHALELYSTCILTYPKDKLVALSGIARSIQSNTGDQYFAGIWRRNSELQICWERATLHPLPRPEYRAPSWSWAAIDGGPRWQKYQGRITTYYTYTLNISVVALGEDPLGQVASGELSFICSVMARGRLSPSNSAGRWRFVTLEDQLDYPFLSDCIDSITGFGENTTLFLLPFVRLGHPGQKQKIRGVVLQPTGASKGQFRRVGSFEFHTHGTAKSDSEYDCFSRR